MALSHYPLRSGPFEVGEIVLGPEVLVMAGRESEELAGKPRPMVHVWYPAAPGEPGARTRGDSGLLSRLGRMMYGAGANTAVRNLPFVAGTQRIPLVIYFPGWPGTQIDNFMLICDLVSRGFIVAGVVYPAPPAGVSGAVLKQQIEQLELPMDYTSEAAYHLTVARATERVRLRARDAVSLLEGLYRIEAAPVASLAPMQQISQRLDLSRAAIIGFSLGGAVAAEASTLEPRFRAVVNMDGRHWGTALERGVSQPYLFIGEELSMPGDADLQSRNPHRRYNALLDHNDYSQLATNLKRNGGIRVVIAGARHLDFSDRTFAGGFRRLLSSGRIEPRRAMHIVNSYIIAFLEMSLLDKASPLLSSGAQPFPEARLYAWKH